MSGAVLVAATVLSLSLYDWVGIGVVVTWFLGITWLVSRR